MFESIGTRVKRLEMLKKAQELKTVHDNFLEALLNSPEIVIDESEKRRIIETNDFLKALELTAAQGWSDYENERAANK